MKKTAVIFFAVATILMAGFGREVGAEDVSKDVLAQMGLGGMKQMSDDEGLQVRGQGLASVYGIGFATLLMPGFLKTYQATSGPMLNAVASGDALSEVKLSLSVGLGTTSISLNLTASAGGQSFAFGR